ncbi:MAG: ATP-dependent helicase, partial [bacterium]|nr:ATP-dependent helicase [bacterium]
MKSFEQELKKLNPAQRRAVNTIEGPVMVVAGPGTGKTQVLTLRIANIRVKTDTPPESILALTFTDAAAGEMRERLVEIMASARHSGSEGGGSDGYKVAIRTFHSFCNEIITEYPESFGHITGGSSVADVDQIQIVRKLVDDLDLELLRSFGKPYGQVRDVLKAISELKREGVSPDEFAKIIKNEEASFDEIEDLYNEKGKYKGKMKGKYVTQEKQIAKHKELLLLYRGYQKELSKTQRYDYDDMLIEAAIALRRDKALLQTLHEKYLYVLVDEHQDTNSAQTAVLELLTSYDDSPNLFMVGDEKQAIYRFQGASLENFEYFKKRFPKSKIINLEDNYRSTQTIIDAATDIALGKGGLKAKGGHKEAPISLYEFSGVDEEVFGIAKDIEGAIKSGIKPEEIAVLYRENKESQAIGSMLGRLGVPYTISADDDVLTDAQIQKLLRILLAVRHFGQASYLCEALLVDVWGLDPLDVYQFTTYCRDNRLSHYQVIRTLASLKKVGLDNPDLARPGTSGAAKLHRVYQGLAGWKVLADNEGAAKVFEFIVRESGYLAAILKKEDSVAHLAKLHALFDMVKEFMLRKRTGTLHDFVDELELLREHEVRIRPSSIVNSLSSKVNLMTAH